MRVFLQVWTNHILYIYTLKKNKIRVHTCSTETFSFLVSKYFWRFCPHLVLLEHSLTNKSSLKKVPWNIFQSALLEQKCFVEISFLMMFWSGKLLSVLKQEVISAGWRERGKRGIFIKSQSLLMRKTSIHQNPASQNSEKCAKCCKNKVAQRSLMNTITNNLNLGDRKVDVREKWTRVEEVVTGTSTGNRGREIFGEKMGSNGGEGTTAGESSQEKVMKSRRWDLHL